MDRIQASLESAKVKVKACRERGATTNMVKLMELEEERDTLQAEFDKVRSMALVEFESRDELLEIDGIAAVLGTLAAHKQFFEAGLAKIEALTPILNEFQVFVKSVWCKILPFRQNLLQLMKP